MWHKCEVMGKPNQFHQLKLLQKITLMTNWILWRHVKIKKCKSCNINQTNLSKTSYFISVRCIPLNMRSKTRRKATLLLPTWIYSCQSVGTVNFILPFTTSVTILISILQTFRSWAATSYLHPPMAFLSPNSSDMPGLDPLMNALFWGRCDFPISFSGRDMKRNVWDRL